MTTTAFVSPRRGFASRAVHNGMVTLAIMTEIRRSFWLTVFSYSTTRTSPSGARIAPRRLRRAVASHVQARAPPLSPWDEEGFSSCSTRPGPRAIALTPPEWPVARTSLRRSMLPSHSHQGIGLRSFALSRLPVRSTLRPLAVLRSPRQDASTVGRDQEVEGKRNANRVCPQPVGVS